MKRVQNYLRSFFVIFCRITVGILFAAATFIEIFWGHDTQLDVEIIWQILLTAALCALGCASCSTEEKEVSKRRMLLRNILFFIYINIVVLGLGIVFEWFYLSSMGMLIGMEVAIVIVYIAVTLVSYALNYKEAEEMNRKLMERK